MGKKYIHYGHDKFQPEKLINRPRDPYMQLYKPAGLWASPVDSEWGWKDWCEREEFDLERLTTHFTFALSPDARVLEIHHADDIKDYLIANEEHWGPERWYNYTLDTKAIERDYDAMEVYMSDNYTELHDTSIFYIYDVDSLVVWNPDVIIAE